MASFSNSNAIVNYLNTNKARNIDVGKFVEITELNKHAQEKMPANAFNEAAEVMQNTGLSENEEATQTITTNLNFTNLIKHLKIVDEPIKLIILELKNGELTLDCNVFLIDADKMHDERYIISLNHVIIGKTGDEYTVIGYVESVKPQTQRPRSASSSSPPCISFKLAEINSSCTVLPRIITQIINACLTNHYIDKRTPAAVNKFYGTEFNDDEQADARKAEEEAAAEAAAEVNDADKCDFKSLLKSKIKNESNEYCKVTDRGLLERIKQNIDGDGVDVNVDGLNDLIKTRLDGIKKVTDGDGDNDNEETENKNNKKTISEKKEAQMIREANEMFVISQQVLKKINEGTTYSSKKFFKDYLKNAMVTEQEEKEAEPSGPAQADKAGPSQADTTGVTVAAPVAAPVALTEASAAQEAAGAAAQVAVTATAVQAEKAATAAPALAAAVTGPGPEAAVPVTAAPAPVAAAAANQEQYTLLTFEYIYKKNKTINNDIINKDVYYKTNGEYINRGTVKSVSVELHDGINPSAALKLNNDIELYIENESGDELYIVTPKK